MISANMCGVYSINSIICFILDILNTLDDLKSVLKLIRSHKQLHKNVSLLKMLRNAPIIIKRGKT